MDATAVTASAVAATAVAVVRAAAVAPTRIVGLARQPGGKMLLYELEVKRKPVGIAAAPTMEPRARRQRGRSIRRDRRRLLRARRVNAGRRRATASWRRARLAPCPMHHIRFIIRTHILSYTTRATSSHYSDGLSKSGVTIVPLRPAARSPHTRSAVHA